MRYGKEPKDLGVFLLKCDQMLFYQYLPIKLKGQRKPLVEERLYCFHGLINRICHDFISEYGLDRYLDSNIYLTAKRLFQGEGYSFNRKGYHSDGFMTDDINYLWSDSTPTVFNSGDFHLSLDDNLSMLEMEDQAKKENEYSYEKGSLLRLDQFVIHKVSSEIEEGMRTFVKISFSKDRYDLKGNSKNYLLNYDWMARDRSIKRNIPQEII